MSQATEMLAKYIAAESAVLDGKEASFDGRTYKSEDLDAIRAGRKEWEAKVASELMKASKARNVGGLAISHARLR